RSLVASPGRRNDPMKSLWVLVVVSLVAGCQDQILGDVRSPDGSTVGTGLSNSTPTCASMGGSCGALSACAVGQGHLAPATSDCGSGTTACCLPEGACPTETFMCCGQTTGAGVAKTRPLCEPATPGAAAKLVCAAGLNSC